MPAKDDLNSREDYQNSYETATQELLKTAVRRGADRNVAAPLNRGNHLEFVNRSIREWIATKCHRYPATKAFCLTESSSVPENANFCSAC
jgi:hypothetical protein